MASRTHGGRMGGAVVGRAVRCPPDRLIPRYAAFSAGSGLPALLCLALAGVAAGAPATAPAEGAAAEQRREIAALRVQAAGRDFDKAAEALKGLEALGAAGRDDLRAMLKSLLGRNDAALVAAAKAAGTADQSAESDKKLADLRVEAIANIAKLKKDDDSLAKATAYYKKLRAMVVRDAHLQEARSRIVDALAQRLVLQEISKRVGTDAAAGVAAGAAGGKEVKDAKDPKDIKPKGAIVATGGQGATFVWGPAGGAGGAAGKPAVARPGAVTPAAPATPPDPVQLAERALGVPLAGLAGMEELAKAPELRDLFRFRVDRQTDAWNRQLAKDVHPEEYADLQAVNDYREALGVPRLELDLRLTQSARRHSKEMVDLSYFSHDSPTKGSEGFADREKNAGYPAPGGENIAFGTNMQGGLAAFDMWFGSPPHHQNMVRENFTAMGAGKWIVHWTQNFGQGPRLAMADEATRKAAAPTGKLLGKSP